jgi:hypothetical protein
MELRHDHGHHVHRQEIALTHSNPAALEKGKFARKPSVNEARSGPDALPPNGL